ncbi:MAG: hypothetical protein KDK36_11480, partial [Leptospiraceae bacterium]|nr:hypothetical protein [Leptospiraceae bacterium]
NSLQKSIEGNTFFFLKIMKLNELNINGRICIFLKNINSLKLENYKKSIRENYFGVIKNPDYLFYSKYLKNGKKIDEYPMIQENEVEELFSNYQVKTRYKRLQTLVQEISYFKFQTTDSNINQILEYAKENDWSRVIIFKSNHILRDENRLLKIFKMNSFLNLRDTNVFYASNLFNSNGYIREPKLNKILEGKARYSSDSTFKMITLELDQEINSNLTRIKYIKEGKIN